MIRSVAVLALLGGMSASSLQAEDPYEPLYSGTLLQFYGQNIPPGHVSVEPYVYALYQYGTYTPQWKVSSSPKFNSQQWFVFVETGITPFVDFNLNVPYSTSESHGRYSAHVGDLQVYLGFQLLKAKKGEWTPDMRLLVGEFFPTGKYDRLDPKKEEADISGAGAFTTALIYASEKILYIWPRHPLNLNINLYYIWLTKVKVHGFNAYGGNAETRGVVNPGNQFIVNLAAELSLTRNWVVGCDLHYVHLNRSDFHGHAGEGPSPTEPSSEQWSLAPCIEYNFSEKFDVSFGSWFTFAGRNSPAFAGGIATVYWYF